MQKGMSPLYIVSKNNRVEVAKVLLEYGAQVNLPNNVWLSVVSETTYTILCAQGDTALFIVSWYGHIKLAELLLDYGAEVDYQNKVIML